MEVFVRVFSESWRLLQEMAPSLWIGFLVAGALAILLPRAFVKRHLSKPGLGSVFKAAVLGSPMPLCSCGVVPVAVELKKLGASPGAVAAFLISTPQTGVENILVCLALLGPVFAIASPIVAVVSGLVVGLLVQALAGTAGVDPKLEPEPAEIPPPPWRVFARTAFRSLPRDLALPLLVGLLVSGALAALVPADYFKQLGGDGWAAKLSILAVSIPMYVCSAASIPIAASFIVAGLSPGAALVFLMAGPATNGATLAALLTLFGRKGAVVFLASFIVCVLGFARLLDLVVVKTGAPMDAAHCHMDLTWWHPVLAVGLIVLMLAAKFRK